MNVAEMRAYLNAPIPRKAALAVVGFQAVAQGYIALQALKAVNTAHAARIADAEQRVNILKESTMFLVDRAKPEDVDELNQNLDYWRLIRGMAPSGTPEAQMTPFEEYFGHDIPLAQKWLTDPYKAPEQRRMAQEFLDQVGEDEKGEES